MMTINLPSNRNDYNRAKIFFISMFVEPRLDGYIPYFPGWQSVLNSDPKRVVEELTHDGVLGPPDLKTKISLTFLVPGLKSLLRERKLKVSGRKSDLVDRLLKHDPSTAENLVRNVQIIGCTEWGNQLSDEYKQFCDCEFNEFEQNLIQALKQGQFAVFLDLINNYARAQVPLSGYRYRITLPSIANDSQRMNDLEEIFNFTPPSYSHLRPNELATFRLAAGLLHLGMVPPDHIFPQDFSPDLRVKDRIWATRGFLYSLDFEKAKRELFQSRAQYLADKELFKNDPEMLKLLKESGDYKYAYIHSAMDDYVCPECKKLAKNKHNIDQLPNLPFSGCTNPDGCRCHLSPFPYEY
jgi:hypothetical protein